MPHTNRENRARQYKDKNYRGKKESSDSVSSSNFRFSNLESVAKYEGYVPRAPKANLSNIKKSSLQKQIRSLSRVLQKEGLLEAVKTGIEAKIRNLKAAHAANLITEKERAHSIKYHKVKFIEKRKLVRRISLVRKKLAQLADFESGSERNENMADDYKKLNEEIEMLEKQLKYVLYYPRDRKYIALFTNEERDPLSLKRLKKAEEVALEACAADDNALFDDYIRKFVSTAMNLDLSSANKKSVSKSTKKPMKYKEQLSLLDKEDSDCDANITAKHTRLSKSSDSTVSFDFKSSQKLNIKKPEFSKMSKVFENPLEPPSIDASNSEYRELILNDDFFVEEAPNPLETSYDGKDNTYSIEKHTSRENKNRKRSDFKNFQQMGLKRERSAGTKQFGGEEGPVRPGKKGEKSSFDRKKDGQRSVFSKASTPQERPEGSGFVKLGGKLQNKRMKFNE